MQILHLVVEVLRDGVDLFDDEELVVLVGFDRELLLLERVHDLLDVHLDFVLFECFGRNVFQIERELVGVNRDDVFELDCVVVSLLHLLLYVDPRQFGDFVPVFFFNGLVAELVDQGQQILVKVQHFV